ncbi:hypothetical protein [Variovorax sp. J31P207]|uniref:hypothetical protein n=1 Tax=Variovorax sp. J31P207 TaxID=3053510 RepID=UPI0025776EBE|nr:hypothetical protein [Variovorax sp. J31P207]MDM0071459.1 hypothetical protein [Variovorax sp. J31P207]
MLSFRISPEREALVRAEAARAGVSVSELLRQRLAGESTVASGRPSPRKPPVRRRSYMPEDPALVAEVAVVGNLLEALWRSLQHCKHSQSTVDLAAVLTVLRAIEAEASRALSPLRCREVEEYGLPSPKAKPASRQGQPFAGQGGRPC